MGTQKNVNKTKNKIIKSNIKARIPRAKYRLTSRSIMRVKLQRGASGGLVENNGGEKSTFEIRSSNTRGKKKKIIKKLIVYYNRQWWLLEGSQKVLAPSLQDISVPLLVVDFHSYRNYYS